MKELTDDDLKAELARRKVERAEAEKKAKEEMFAAHRLLDEFACPECHGTGNGYTPHKVRYDCLMCKGRKFLSGAEATKRMSFESEIKEANFWPKGSGDEKRAIIQIECFDQIIVPADDYSTCLITICGYTGDKSVPGKLNGLMLRGNFDHLYLDDIVIANRNGLYETHMADIDLEECINMYRRQAAAKGIVTCLACRKYLERSNK